MLGGMRWIADGPSGFAAIRVLKRGQKWPCCGGQSGRSRNLSALMSLSTWFLQGYRERLASGHGGN
jgi:hypothetical protein